MARDGAFSGTEGVLGLMGIYRAAFTMIAQTAPLKKNKVKVPILGLGGEKALGDKVAEMLRAVAENVSGRALAGCGHFIPEEKPAELVRVFQEFVSET